MERCLTKPFALREELLGAFRELTGAAASCLKAKKDRLRLLAAALILLLSVGALLSALPGREIGARMPPAASGPAAFRGKDWNGIVDVVAGNGFTAGLRRDGTVAYSGNDYGGAGRRVASWKNIERIELAGWADYINGDDYLIGYRKDGTVALESLRDWSEAFSDTHWQEKDFSSWKDVRQLWIASSFCLGLHGDGTVSLLAADAETQDALRAVTAWKGIEQLATDGYSLVVGLKADGTVVSTDDEALAEQGAYWGSSWGPRKDWNGIRTLAGSWSGVYAIKWDGTVLGQRHAGWTNIDSLYFAPDSMFGLRRDGTVAVNFYGDQAEDERLAEIAGWTDIVQLGFDITGITRYVPVGLRADGTVRAVTWHYGERYADWDFTGWSGVKKLYSGTDYTIGLRADGTLLVTGGEFGTADFLYEVSRWTDIAEIYAAPGEETDHIVGLKFDGTLVAAGNNDAGQCEVRR